MGHWSNYPFRGTNVAVRASVLKSLCSQLFLAGYLALFGSCDLPILYVDQSLDYTSEVPHKKTNNVFCVFGDSS
jgi:hypothetical protein